MTERGSILVIEDDSAMREVLERGLTRRGFSLRLAASGAEGLAHLRDSEADAVLTDLRLGSMDGIELAHHALAIQPGVPVIVMTAFGSLDTAVAAIRAGAYDFLTKPLDLDAATLALDRAVQYRRLRADLVRLKEAQTAQDGAPELIGESAAIRQALELARRAASTDVTVLVTGESGTGKEVMARTLHRWSPRRDGPFVAINCAALPENLLESELFGHVRGAFTDAKTPRAGLFAQAAGGTIFLDEVGEIALSMQAKLLRVLEDRKVRPVGSDKEFPVDVRIVAATNRDLKALSEANRFREDLYFRLAVMEIDLPPLRARGNDVLLIAQSELTRRAGRSGKEIRGLAPETARLLLRYNWPGNVRELQNSLERAIAMARFDHIAPEDLPERVRSSKPVQALPVLEGGEELLPLEEIERRYVHYVMEAVHGHRTQAARILGLDRKTLYRKLEQWGDKGQAEKEE